MPKKKVKVIKAWAGLTRGTLHWDTEGPYEADVPAIYKTRREALSDFFAENVTLLEIRILR